jgi:hypothetical protein
MKDPIPQTAYDEAAVVVSRSLRFVEWRYILLAELPVPFALPRTSIEKAIQEIDREKWIYVFRHDAGDPKSMSLQEEIRFTAGGEMEATPHEDEAQLENASKNRAAPKPIGRTLCLPRRICGKPVFYRLFASRMRLQHAQLKDLKEKIYRFVPATNLQAPDRLDASSVVEKGGELLVPVVDPITVMLQLHAAYVAALNDVIRYTTSERRRKKQFLASILKGIIGDHKNTAANNLVNKLVDNQHPLEQFLADYDAECQWRVRQRDLLASALVKWLKSDAIAFTAAASKGLPKAKWVDAILLPWCHSITRLSETREGKAYLVSLPGNKSHFANPYVWPRQKPDDEVVRRGGLRIFEAWLEVAVAKVLLQKEPPIGEVDQSLRSLLGSSRAGITERTTKDLVEIGKRIDSTIISIADATVDAKTIAAGHQVASEAVDSFKPRFESLEQGLGLLNFALTVREASEKLDSSDANERQLAMVSLAGAGLDATGTILKMAKLGPEKLAQVMGFISGVIDVYLGKEKMDEAFKVGNQARANSAFLSTAGATFGTSAGAMVLIGIPGANFVVLAGILLSFIATILEWGEDPPMEAFFAHCTWGKQHGKGDGVDWSPTKFSEWKGPREFDNQFEALLNVICKPDVGIFDGNVRELKIKMGWVPDKARLSVVYFEQWEGEAYKNVSGEVVIAGDKASTTQAGFQVSLTSEKEGSVLRVRVMPSHLSKGHPTVKPTANPLMQDVKFVGGLQEVRVGARLIVKSLDGKRELSIPHGGKLVEKTLAKDGMVRA